jgi:glutathione S-transferase
VLRVLGRSTSINVRKVLWTLGELGLTYTHDADWATPARPTSDPDFLALNPNGLVPVLVDGHQVLWESNTICRYLAARHGRTDLLPADSLARARVEQWMDWQATELNDAWRPAFQALVRQRDQPHDPAVVARSVIRWNQLMGLLDAQLGRTGAHIAGDTFTVADIVLGLSIHRWCETPIERPALPALSAYITRLAQRPGWQDHCRTGVP